MVMLMVFACSLFVARERFRHKTRFRGIFFGEILKKHIAVLFFLLSTVCTDSKCPSLSAGAQQGTSRGPGSQPEPDARDPGGARTAPGRLRDGACF